MDPALMLSRFKSNAQTEMTFRDAMIAEGIEDMALIERVLERMRKVLFSAKSFSIPANTDPKLIATFRALEEAASEVLTQLCLAYLEIELLKKSNLDDG